MPPRLGCVGWLANKLSLNKLIRTFRLRIAFIISLPHPDQKADGFCAVVGRNAQPLLGLGWA